MVNIKRLLSKICENIAIFKNWKSDVESTIDELYGESTGTVVSTSLSDDKSIPNNTWTEVLKITLSPGTWIINGRATFAYNATGYRSISITTRDAATKPATTNFNVCQDPITVNSGSTMLTDVCYAYELTQDTVYYLHAIHTRGSALNITAAGLVAVKIAD